MKGTKRGNNWKKKEKLIMTTRDIIERERERDYTCKIISNV